MDMLDRLLGHDEWTTSELLRRATELTEDQYHQRFDIGWETVHRTLAHMIENVQVWTDLMAGRDASHSTDGWWEFNLGKLTDAHRSSYAQFSDRARSVRNDQRWNVDFIDTLDKPPRTKSLGGGILHVVTHNMHHRSEILHMLAGLGLENLPEGDHLGWEEQQLTMKGTSIP